MKDYYKVLGITPKATEKEIKTAYRILVKKYHPDIVKNNSQMNEKMYEIQAAYEVLGVEEKRKKYDEALNRQLKKTEDKRYSGSKTEAKNSNMTEFERFFGFQPGKGMETYKKKQTNTKQTGGVIDAEALFAAYFRKKK